jgi:hypothetical protein
LETGFPVEGWLLPPPVRITVVPTRRDPPAPADREVLLLPPAAATTAAAAAPGPVSMARCTPLGSTSPKNCDCQ